MHGVYSMIVERAKNCHKFKRFEVNSSIQTSNFGGFRSTVQAKPHKKPSEKQMSLIRFCMQAYKSCAHFTWTTNGFTEKLSIDCHQSIES